MGIYRPLICLTFCHLAVDTCAILVSPLWAELKDSHDLSADALFLVLTVQALAPSFSQAAFGYLRDRMAAQFLIWAGPVTAAVCFSLIGFTSSTTMLCALLFLGGVGIGAFHPEATVAAGRALPNHRTRGLLIFTFGGAMGLSLGPILSGQIVGSQGLKGLMILGPVLAGFVIFFHWLGQSGETESRPISGTSLTLSEMFSGKLSLAFFLLAICSLRLVPNMGIDKILAFKLGEQGIDPSVIGRIQSVFLLSASATMLFLAFRFRPGSEKRYLIACPLLGIPLLGVLSWSACPLWLTVVMLVPAGIILWGTTPIMVSYAHGLFPQAAGLASALTMGVSWGFGGVLQAGVTSHFVSRGTPETAFLAFTPFLAFSALGACFLPDSVTEPEAEIATESNR